MRPEAAGRTRSPRVARVVAIPSASLRVVCSAMSFSSRSCGQKVARRNARRVPCLEARNLPPASTLPPASRIHLVASATPSWWSRSVAASEQARPPAAFACARGAGPSATKRKALRQAVADLLPAVPNVGSFAAAAHAPPAPGVVGRAAPRCLRLHEGPPSCRRGRRWACPRRGAARWRARFAS